MKNIVVVVIVLLVGLGIGFMLGGGLGQNEKPIQKVTVELPPPTVQEVLMKEPRTAEEASRDVPRWDLNKPVRDTSGSLLSWWWCPPEVSFKKDTTLTRISGHSSTFREKKVRVCKVKKENGESILTELAPPVVADYNGAFSISVSLPGKTVIESDMQVIIQCDDAQAHGMTQGILVECVDRKGVPFKMDTTSPGVFCDTKGMTVSIDTPEGTFSKEDPQRFIQWNAAHIITPKRDIDLVSLNFKQVAPNHGMVLWYDSHGGTDVDFKITDSFSMPDGTIKFPLHQTFRIPAHSLLEVRYWAPADEQAPLGILSEFIFKEKDGTSKTVKDLQVNETDKAYYIP